MPRRITLETIKQVQEDAKREIWDKTESFLDFAREHLNSLTPRDETTTQYNRQNVVENWLEVDPAARLEFIRGCLDDEIEDLLEELDKDRDSNGVANPKHRNKKKKKKKKNINPRKHKAHQTRKRKRRNRRKKRRRRRMRLIAWFLCRGCPNEPNPNPEDPDDPDPDDPDNPDNPDGPDDDEDVVEEDPGVLEPPGPRPVDSPPVPPSPRKLVWDSRVGYFVALSNITWYEEVPRIIESPFVDIDFEDEEGFLRLEPGDVWESEWFETGVIRGLNIDVMGKHKINYSKNGDFEI